MRSREALALNLRRHRRLRGLSQEELAHRAGIDRTYVSALERGVYAASVDVLDRLAQVLGTEAADLLRGVGSAPEPPARLGEQVVESGEAPDSPGPPGMRGRRRVRSSGTG